MYEEFYDLRETPFNLTPDPRFLFYSHRHREAYDHLFFGITQRKGFIQLTGEVGAGKTTLCRALLEGLGEDFDTALVLNPVMTSIQLLRTVLRELGLEHKGNDRVRLMGRLNAYLLE
ncbi:MAG: AAA family ATPase, partial [Acidobacteriota bacterium]